MSWYVHVPFNDLSSCLPLWIIEFRASCRTGRTSVGATLMQVWCQLLTTSSVRAPRSLPALGVTSGCCPRSPDFAQALPNVPRLPAAPWPQRCVCWGRQRTSSDAQASPSCTSYYVMGSNWCSSGMSNILSNWCFLGVWKFGSEMSKQTATLMIAQDAYTSSQQTYSCPALQQPSCAVSPFLSTTFGLAPLLIRYLIARLGRALVQ